MEDIDFSSVLNFNKARILVCGDVILDKYWSGQTDRISPEAPIPIVKINNKKLCLGGSANVANNVKSLKGNVTLLGLIGEDESGKHLKALLDAQAIEYYLLSHPSYTTIQKLRIVSQNQHLLRIDHEQFFSEVCHEELFSNFVNALDKNQVAILADYNKGTLRNLPVFIRAAQEAKVLTLIDPKQADISLYRDANILTPNLKECKMLLGDFANNDELIAKAKAALIEYNIDAFLITQSQNGMTLVQQNGEATHIPAVNKEVFDVTGAGDTVIAVFGLALAEGIDILSAAKLSNYAASIVVQKMGTASLNVSEMATISNRNIINKSLPLDDLLSIIKQAKDKGQKIVFTNGCFDILHLGHVQYLNAAKKLGHILIVGVNSDNSVKILKGSSRPIHSLSDRMAVLSALESIDYVLSFEEETPERLIQMISPDILVKGGDYTDPDALVGSSFVKSNGGLVKILKLAPNCSTTRIIDKIKRERHQSF